MVSWAGSEAGQVEGRFGGGGVVVVERRMTSRNLDKEDGNGFVPQFHS
jgi:hypothetical protein